MLIYKGYQIRSLITLTFFVDDCATTDFHIDEFLIEVAVLSSYLVTPQANDFRRFKVNKIINQNKLQVTL